MASRKGGRGRETHKRGHDAARVPDHQLQPRRRRAFSVSRTVRRQPGERQADDDVQAEGDDEAGEVMHARPRVGHEDAVADRRDGAEDDAVQTAQLLSIREPRDEQVGQRAEHVAGDGERLDLGRGPAAEGLDDGGEEGRVAVEHGVGAELAEAEGVDLPVREAEADVVAVEFLGRGGLADLSVLAHDHESLLGWRQIVGVARVVGEDPEGGDAEDEGGQALDDHDPAPAAQAGDAVHVADGVGEEAARGPGQGGADEEVGDAQGQFLFRVEEGQVDSHAGEETAFDEAEEEAAGDEGAVVVAEAGQSRDDAPDRGDEGDPAGGAEFFDYQVAGEFG